jgi:hypothetical protein
MDEAVLSEEAVPNQNYAERIAYLEKEIKANPRKNKN